MNEKAGRNDPCPCGSGKKYKQCCWGKESQKTYTPSGKRKFKATVLSSVDKSQQIFGQSASTEKAGDRVVEPGFLLKFRKTREDYKIKEGGSTSKEEKAPFVFKQPSSPVEQIMDMEAPFKPTHQDFQKEKKEE